MLFRFLPFRQQNEIDLLVIKKKQMRSPYIARGESTVSLFSSAPFVCFLIADHVSLVYVTALQEH